MHIPERIRWLIMALAVCVIAFSLYKVAAYYADEYKNRTQYNELRKVFHAKEDAGHTSNPPVQNLVKSVPLKTDILHSILPSAATDQPPQTPAVQERFQALLKLNSDLVGWLAIPGTSIDYPVVQSKDNDYYLTRDVSKRENVNGSIFMDFRDSIIKAEKNTILYGHNMMNKTMFYDLLNYESKWYFDNNSIIEFDSIYGNHKWKIFSVYFTDVKHDYIQTDFKTKEEYKAFLEDVKGRSLFKSDIEVYENDKILTLSTCAGITNDARMAVHAKLIQ